MKTITRVFQSYFFFSLVLISVSFAATVKKKSMIITDIDTIDAQELGSGELQELNASQSQTLIDIYQDNPEDYYIVQEEIIEEDLGSTDTSHVSKSETVKEVKTQNFKLEVATVGNGKSIGDSQLTKESIDRLKKIAALLNENSDSWKNSAVHGYSSVFDTAGDNLEISHRRAFLVLHSLAQDGVDQNKMTIRAFAKKKKPNENPNSIWRNNRIIYIFVNDVPTKTILAHELRKIEEQPINISIPQRIATKTKVIYKKSPPKIVYRSKKPEIFKIEVRGVGSNFKTDEDKIAMSDRRRLKRLAILLDLHRDQWKDVSILGHTDERGTYQYNIDLSKRRALSVLDILKSEGVPSDRMSTKALGYTQPLVNKSNAYGWQKNRRTEIEISGVHKGTALSKALNRLIKSKTSIQ